MASGQWQLHTEKAAPALCAVDGDLAAVGQTDRADDGQSQTGSAHLPGTRFICSIETIEDMGQIICRYAQPRIRDFENRMSVPLRHSDGALSPFGRVLNGMVQQVTYSLLHASGLGF